MLLVSRVGGGQRPRASLCCGWCRAGGPHQPAEPLPGSMTAARLLLLLSEVGEAAGSQEPVGSPPTAVKAGRP